MKKALTWLGVILGVLWVIHNPDQAAADVHQVLTALTELASKI